MLYSVGLQTRIMFLPEDQREFIRERLQYLKLNSLSEYRKTSRWKGKRQRQFRRGNMHGCKCCGSNFYLNLHHRTYERLGNELREDLIWLCKDCHKLVHEFCFFRGLSLEDATDSVIKGMKIKDPCPVKTKKVKEDKNRKREGIIQWKSYGSIQLPITTVTR